MVSILCQACNIVKDQIGGALNNAFVWVLLIVVSIFTENKFGLVKKIKRLWHKIMNSSCQFSFVLIFSSNIRFDNIKNQLRECFKREYKNIKIYKDSIGALEMKIDNSFTISLLKNPNNEISLLTSKLKTGMRELNKDIDKLLNVIDVCQNNLNNQNHQNKFTDKEINIKLFLPYKNPYTKIYPPKNIYIKDYEIELSDKQYASIIKLKIDVLNVSITKRANLSKVLKRFT